MKRNRMAVVVTCTLALGIVCSEVVHAQGGLEEIVVTARKREESIQEAPISVRAITAETIQRYELNNLEAIAAMSPEFSVGRASNGSGAQLNIRGIGSSSSSIGIEQSVAVIVDGVYYGQGRVINEGMLDMERVELLKGPQALFFGKNATAGAVSLTTANPTDELEVSLKVGYEFEAEETIGEFVVSGPLSDKMGARLALRASDMRGGLFTNRAQAINYTPFDVATGEIETLVLPAGKKNVPASEELMGRLTLDATPTDRLSLNLKLSSTRNENENPAYNNIKYWSPTGSSALNPNNPVRKKFTIYQNDYSSEMASLDRYAKSSGKLFNEYKSKQATVTVGYEMNNFTLIAVSNYQENKNTFACDCDLQSDIFNSPVFVSERSTWEAFSQEVRLTSSFDFPLNFMLGILYQETERDFSQQDKGFGLQNTAAENLYNHYDFYSKESRTDGETLSPFFQVMWSMTPDFELTAGARYTDEEKKSAFVQPYVNPALLPVWREGEVAAAKQKFSDWSPEVTLSWNVAEDVMLYAAYKTAYKSGGFSNSAIYAQTTVVDDFTFGPETSKGFEAGIKSTLLDNQLRLNVTAYIYEYKDLQVDYFNSPSFAFITLNAGNAETKGFEIESEYAPRLIAGLTVRGALNYNRARYKDFIAPCWSGQTPAQGCNTIAQGTAATPGQDISGKSTAVAPEWTAALGVNYELTLPRGYALSLSGNAQYVDDYFVTGFGNPYARQSSYTKLDASIRLSPQSEKWEVSLIGKNLTNEFIVADGVEAPSTGSGTGTAEGVPADQIGFAADPRTIALRVRMSF